VIQLIPADRRGHTRTDWLDSRHTFSFGDYYDPERMGFRTLRVVNDDRVKPGEGFPTHAHRDMEIVTYVLEGRIEHQDSMGNKTLITAGEVQRMSAGTGVRHSEYNPSATEPLHFLQIWVIPERSGLPPSYEQKRFDEESRRGRLTRVAGPGGEGGAMTIHQDVTLHAGLFAPHETYRHRLAPGRFAFVHLATGALDLNGQPLRAGDGAAIGEELVLDLGAREESNVLVFDLG
jgi:redox-sensitive bicupin YhaK (pirin superfamily)